MTDLTFSIEKTRFDEDYKPLGDTRLTTNFANLARGEGRRENLRRALQMIDDRFNALAGDEEGGRCSVELDIISVNIDLEGDGGLESFPLIEMLQTGIVDRRLGQRTEGIVGNNFSSYVRDYDFSMRLREHAQNHPDSGLPEDFGVLHGNLFKGFLQSEGYTQHFGKPPVICISVSSSRTYHRTENSHPVLGVEYQQDDYSLTDEYFGKMGMRVRYFMPPGSAAPLAFYFLGDLTEDYTDLELIATISTMETFQKIYRPEIYSANTPAGQSYRPSLDHADYTPTGIVYDREERSRLGVEQGRFAQEALIAPHHEKLEQWSARFSDHHHPSQGETS
ncbi:putative oxygenase MesX [Nesterenkonia flava]|uniref:DUF1852 family protein n=1 Tax=Nesterenkonia flava TaxID=469799 RepID=A0ABU1FTP0_9MICC|nr:putative oxygenase MesX [Nesterenkonia flava]MDR5712026.1 DUF1852 family protein [Nesterenkonia flava]